MNVFKYYEMPEEEVKQEKAVEAIHFTEAKADINKVKLEHVDEG